MISVRLESSALVGDYHDGSTPYWVIFNAKSPNESRFHTLQSHLRSPGCSLWIEQLNLYRHDHCDKLEG